jgi:hypothetical protein
MGRLGMAALGGSSKSDPRGVTSLRPWPKLPNNSADSGNENVSDFCAQAAHVESTTIAKKHLSFPFKHMGTS